MGRYYIITLIMLSLYLFAGFGVIISDDSGSVELFSMCVRGCNDLHSAFNENGRNDLINCFKACTLWLN